MFLTDRLDINTERTYTDEGFLSVPARISRIGVQQYLASEMGLTDRDPKEPVLIFRPESEVFDQTSLESFANKPVTNNHPPDLISSKNAKKFAVGHAGPEVVRDGDFAKTTLYVNDAEAIASIESGKVELSNGYTADIDWTPGITPDGISYDAVQRNIKGNHIAIVERGRAGAACRVADQSPKPEEIKTMSKITVDGVDFDVSEQAAQAVSKLQARLRDAEEETMTAAEKLKKKEDEEAEKLKEAKKEEDSLHAKIDSLKESVPTADKLDKLVADRMTLIDTARKIAPTVEWKGKDADALRKEIVSVSCPNVCLDDASADYITARFDILAEGVAGNNQTTLDAGFAKLVTEPSSPGPKLSPAKEARNRMIADAKVAYLPKGVAK